MTLREICWAMEARQRSMWAPFSSLMALIANVNRDAKRHPRPYSPADYDPFSKSIRQPRGIPITPQNIHLLKAMIPKKKR